jgi:hypothetical protein
MDFAAPIIGLESGGHPNAKNPRSSATGPGQFIDGTWLDMIHKYRPDLEQGRSRGEILGLRSDPDLSKDMTNNYAQENQAFLQSKGLPVTPGTTYLGHFLGPQGAAKVLGAPPDASARDILGDSVVAANPFLGRMTAGDLRQWAEGKMQAQPLPAATDVPNAPPIAGPAPTNPGAQSPSLGAAPSQTQQLVGAGGNGGAPQAPPVNGPQAPQLQLRQAQQFRPQVNMQYLQQAMQNFPAILRGFL